MDNFSGNNAHLCRAIDALLDLDTKGALVPHGVGGHARTMLAAAASRLRSVGPEVWVVSNKDGPDFVAADRSMANDHANDMAEQFPDMGPFNVRSYVQQGNNNGK